MLNYIIKLILLHIKSFHFIRSYILNKIHYVLYSLHNFCSLPELYLNHESNQQNLKFLETRVLFCCFIYQIHSRIKYWFLCFNILSLASLLAFLNSQNHSSITRFILLDSNLFLNKIACLLGLAMLFVIELLGFSFFHLGMVSLSFF